MTEYCSHCGDEIVALEFPSTTKTFCSETCYGAYLGWTDDEADAWTLELKRAIEASEM